jgi:membrane protease YdiL (CAAX protease family)
MPQAPSLADSLLAGGLIAWMVLAVVALIKSGVFAAKPLRTAPRRTSTAFLPIAFGTMILYLAFAGIAMNVGVSLQLFSKDALGLPKEVSATAPATMAEPAAEERPDPEVALRRSTEQMRIQTMSIGAEILACGLALLLAQTLTVGGLRGLGLSPQQIPQGLALGIIAYLILFPLLTLDNFIVSELYQSIGHEPTVHETVKEIERTRDFNVQLIFALVAGLGAPIAEEFFFRGLLQTALIQRGWGFVIKLPPDRNHVPPVYQRWVAIVICSVCFCLLHSIDHMPILFLLSVGLGYLYERTGNLWAPIVLHACFNWWTLALLLIYGPQAMG